MKNLIHRTVQAFSRLAMAGTFILFPFAGSRAAPMPNVPGYVSMTSLAVYPNIETAGIVVSGADLPATAQLFFQQANETTWRTGHPLKRIDDGRLVGSLFGLAPSTTYTIKVTDGSAEITGSLTTQPDGLTFTPSLVLYVNDDAAAGGNGTSSAPYRTIQEAVNLAAPGTQILVADGIYREGITFPASGSAGNWIQVKAEGAAAILDGSDTLSGNIWTQYESGSKVWYTKLSAPITYLARDQKRFYLYDDRSDLMQSRGHDDKPMTEGWFFEPSTLRLYIRSADNPSNHTWQAPRFNSAFNVSERDWIWIEGFEMRFYGTTNRSCGVCLTNASHVVVRRNKIHNVLIGIFADWTGTDAQGNDTRIEFNEIYDTRAAEWTWDSVKGTNMEGTGILIRGHIGAIVRENEVHHFFNGIYTGTSGTAGENPGIAFDVDVYNNRIHHIYDDGFEPEGATINNRFRNNIVDASFVSLSLAPITYGPVWVLRNYFTNFTGRGIKWDRNSDGVVLVYHNTVWTGAGGVNTMDLISPTRNTIMRNNILQSSGYAIREALTGSAGNDWNYDNWYTTVTPRFKWENVDYTGIVQLCASTSLECNGHESLPGLNNPAAGDFSLAPSSPNIDRGIVIPGINDAFANKAPDIGAYESAVIDPAPVVSSITATDQNPTSAGVVNFAVAFSEAVTGVDLAAPFGDFALAASPEITGASIAGVSSISPTTYTVSVNTGSGNGSIRLDVADNDSILDAAGSPLGGTGAGNGNFTTGASYSIFKSAPVVMGIARTDPSPAIADLVHFTITFSETVNGVDLGDFTPLVTGSLTGVTINEVTGSGTIYTVALFTGSGDGTLGLSLADNDSIVNINNVPLGGAGAGNGNFQSSDNYLVDKTIPFVTSILRSDPDPTAANQVHFSVTFSEPVSGVDAGDFLLSPTGGIAGVQLTTVGAVSNSQYAVTVNTGTGSGTLRLDLVDNDSILDATGRPLGGSGFGNGNFASGESYTINKVVVTTYISTFSSNGGADGWVMELKENSEIGGYKNSGAATFILGDEYHNRQYRSILQFQTALLPDNAVVTKVTLMIRSAGVVGTDPFTTHQNILVDICYGAFGSTFGMYQNKALQYSDFQNPSSRDIVGVIQNNPMAGWYWTVLDPAAFPYVNLTGTTQFRLRFQLDDNNDLSDDFMKFYSGDYSTPAGRPQLVVEYYLR